MKAKIINLPQGSDEWHQHRLQHRNASETAIVMGASPWMTPFELWELRTHRRKPSVNAAMQRGTQLEPEARAAYEAATGHVMQPLVLVNGEYSASLDGMTLDAKLFVEIKCPFRGRRSNLWQQTASGEIPTHYAWQIQHQLMVSGADVAHLYVYDSEGRDGILIEVQPQPDQWTLIRKAWDQFMTYINTDSPPPLCDQDVVERTDDGWRDAAEKYMEAKRLTEDAESKLQAAKDFLLKLVNHASESGCGIGVSRYWKKGTIDYKRVPALQDIDLEPFRKPGTLETRITLAR